jgi:hypothetical protein
MKLIKTLLFMVAAFWSPDWALGKTQDSKHNFNELLDALVVVESSGDPNAKGDLNPKTKKYDAIGLFQIHKIYVRDVNRILGRPAYSYKDRLNPVKSREMAGVLLRHYGKGKSLEAMARIHGAGPDGWRNDPHWFVRNRKYTLVEAKQKIENAKKYWAKVQKALKEG